MNDLPPKAIWFYTITITLLIFILIGVYGGGHEETQSPIPRSLTIHDPNQCYKKIITDYYNLRAVKDSLINEIGEKNETKNK
tara:strand:+ start:108 stop:353 length:246 start_codon:yes stop_codon:yes gene_type:complete